MKDFKYMFITYVLALGAILLVLAGCGRDERFYSTPCRGPLGACTPGAGDDGYTHNPGDNSDEDSDSPSASPSPSPSPTATPSPSPEPKDKCGHGKEDEHNKHCP